MFDKKFEDRMSLWREFRDMLEVCDDPIQTAIDFYNQAPATTLAIDPYTQSTWPNPWQLLEENVYCEFVKILAICYSLQLTDRFSKAKVEIHISKDINKDVNMYLVYLDGSIVLGYNEEVSSSNSIPQSIVSQKVIQLPPLH